MEQKEIAISKAMAETAISVLGFAINYAVIDPTVESDTERVKVLQDLHACRQAFIRAAKGHITTQPLHPSK